jgi:AGZA family xanthine/uracil permease-like MFS transporter
MALGDSVAAFFGFDDHGTDYSTELLAGLTTFLTMSYIIVVNPFILNIAITDAKLGVGDGMAVQLLAVTTILSAVAAMLVMGVYANRPFGLASGMGLNAFFVSVVLSPQLGITWQTALAAVFLEGVLFIALTAVGAREYVINLFPEPVKAGVGPGIGLFLAIIGLQFMRITAFDTSDILSFNPILAQDPVAVVSVLGILLTFVLYARGTRGSIVVGVLGTSVLGYLAAAAGFEAAVNEVGDTYDLQPQALAPSDVSGIVTDALAFDAASYDITPLAGAFLEGFGDVTGLTFAMVLFTFFFVDFFDTAGTLVGLSRAADMTDEDGEVPDMDEPLMADAIGTTVGGILGTSTVTTFIESSTGIEEGGRTGFTTLVVAGLFLLTLPFIPLLGLLPAYAPYVALLVVAVFMLRNVTDIAWDDNAHAIPGALTITLMPLTHSIATGIAAGLLTYPLVKTAQGEFDDVQVGQWLLAIAVVTYYVVRTNTLA